MGGAPTPKWDPIRFGPWPNHGACTGGEGGGSSNFSRQHPLGNGPTDPWPRLPHRSGRQGVAVHHPDLAVAQLGQQILSSGQPIGAPWAPLAPRLRDARVQFTAHYPGPLERLE